MQTQRVHWLCHFRFMIFRFKPKQKHRPNEARYALFVNFCIFQRFFFSQFNVKLDAQVKINFSTHGVPGIIYTDRSTNILHRNGASRRRQKTHGEMKGFMNIDVVVVVVNIQLSGYRVVNE